MSDLWGETKIIIKWEHDNGEPKRKHRKKRIAKKWLKKYGMWQMPCRNGVIYYRNNTIFVSRNTYAMLKDYTRWEFKFESLPHHGNSSIFRR